LSEGAQKGTERRAKERRMARKAKDILILGILMAAVIAVQ
jgi:hypothetical protein